MPTPHSAGASPSFPYYSSYSDHRENLIYAFSEATGWNAYMEDRVVVSCPLPGRPAWSLFGVCDGHGGSFCCTFLAKNMPTLIAKEVAKDATENPLSIGMGSDADTTPALLTRWLRSTCAEAERQLKAHPRMAVERTASGNLTCLDSSGSTAGLALVTARYVAVASVGDSRAVLAQKALEPGESLQSPFQLSQLDGQQVLKPSVGSAASRTCLIAAALSRDHKLNDPVERARAEAAGGMYVAC
jgi:serine/threonine protein phosphatase PrpC